MNIDEENIDFLKEVLATKRLQKVRKLRVMDVSESMLEEIKQRSAKPGCPMKVICLHNHHYHHPHKHHHYLPEPRLT